MQYQFFNIHDYPHLIAERPVPITRRDLMLLQRDDQSHTIGISFFNSKRTEIVSQYNLPARLTEKQSLLLIGKIVERGDIMLSQWNTTVF